MRIPVISMYGPWANWVSLGWKHIETRTHDRFSSLAGKRIGIHAAIKWDNGAIELARPFLTNDQITESHDFLKIGGAIICTAHVHAVDWLTHFDSPNALIDCGSIQRFGLFLTSIKVIDCIPCKGKQGIWYHEVPA
jgi:hypothetical protein